MKKSLMLREFIAKYKIGDVYENYDFSTVSSIRLSGKVAYYIKVNSIKGLKRLIKYLNKNNIKYYPIGCSTNSYTCGYDGVVISLNIPKTMKNGKDILLSANHYSNFLAKYYAKRKIATFIGLTMIPGLLAGAIMGNASVMGLESSKYLKYILVINSKGNTRKIKAKKISFSYRSSTLKTNDIIVKACYRKFYDEKALEKFDEIKRHRLQTQPMGPSLGSIFKNGSSYYAGALIEKAGFKGINYNGILISHEHANIWINNNGIVTDFTDLIFMVRLIVLLKFGIRLMLEIKEF